MEKRMKNRLALLGSLLVAGLMLAGIGTAFGAGEVFQGIAEKVRVVIEGNQGTIYEDGKVVQNFTLPEGEYEYTWNTSNGMIRIGKGIINKLEIPEEQVNELIEIAKKDQRVRELLEGKNYKVIAATTVGRVKEKNDTKIYTGDYPLITELLLFEVEGKYYEVNLLNRNVMSVREQSPDQFPSGIRTYYGGTGQAK